MAAAGAEGACRPAPGLAWRPLALRWAAASAMRCEIWWDFRNLIIRNVRSKVLSGILVAKAVLIIWNFFFVQLFPKVYPLSLPMNTSNQMGVRGVVRCRCRCLLVRGVHEHPAGEHPAPPHHAATRQQLLRQRRVRERQRGGYRSWKKSCSWTITCYSLNSRWRWMDIFVILDSFISFLSGL